MKKILLGVILLLSGFLCVPNISYATVSSTTSKVVYTGDGSTSAFAFSFNIYKTSDLVVQKVLISTGVATTLTLTTDYTVALTHAVPTPGTVTLVAGALASTYQLVILRTLPLTQLINITDPYYTTPAATWNEAHDRGTMLSQQLQEQLSRGLLGPTTSSTQLTLPTGVAGQCLGWDGTGAALSNLGCSGSSGSGPGGSAFNPPIADSQLQAITTASKVSGAAVYSLSSLPSGAGKIPMANISTTQTVGNAIAWGTALGVPVYPAGNAVYITGLLGSAFSGLAAIPSGAGVIPIANLATGTPTGSKFIRDDGTLQAVTSSTGITLVSATAVTAAATSGSIAITNTEYYKVVFHLGNLSADDVMSLRFNADNANYRYAFDGRTTGGAITGGSASDAEIEMGTSTDSGTNNFVDGEIFIFPQSGTNLIHITGNISYENAAAALTTYVNFTGVWPSAAVTTFAILTTGGATMTGKVLLYKMSQS